MNNKFFILLCVLLSLSSAALASDKKTDVKNYAALNVDSSKSPSSNSRNSSHSLSSHSTGSNTDSESDSDTGNPAYEVPIPSFVLTPAVPRRNCCDDCVEACCVAIKYGGIGLGAGMTLTGIMVCTYLAVGGKF